MASLNELGTMLCVMCFSVVIFSSSIYYAEHELGDQSMFKSIPDTFWYTLVTMTTVGYGDNVPLTFAGKLIGGLCAVSGVVTVAMMVPMMVTNFEFFYKRDRITAAQQEQKVMSKMHASPRDKPPGEKSSEESYLLNCNVLTHLHTKRISLSYPAWHDRPKTGMAATLIDSIRTKSFLRY